MNPATARRFMPVVYLGGAFLWLALGVEKILPWWVVAMAVFFCIFRTWLALRPR